MTNDVYDISVIVPFKDKSKMTLKCVTSLLKYGPPLKEILLISNNSSPSELAKIKKSIATKKNVKLLEYNHPFNYQKINNWAVKQSQGKFLFFLNNDIELVKDSKGLIERMHKRAATPDAGLVGCLLLYGDKRTIQHAGVYVRPGLLGDHIYVGELYKRALTAPQSSQFPYDITKSRPLTAVTGAAQIVERKKFDAVKGFDERFIICGGDVDLCIRLNKKGYQTWYEGGGFMLHKESQSRAQQAIPYSDFCLSYNAYMNAYDLERGDLFVSKITEKMKS